MFKKEKLQKENRMSYFFGGTVIGMAAGLLAGKLFSNTLSEKTKISEHAILVKKNMNKYSQDDNIHNAFCHKNMYQYHIRSKSVSRYKDKKCMKQPFPAISLNKFNDGLEDNIDNLNLNMCDKNEHKILYNNKNCALFNINIENNTKDNICTNIFSENSKDKKKDKYFEHENIKQELSCIIQPEDNANIKEKNLLDIINSENANNFNEKIYKNIELTDTFNALSINFCGDNTTYKNFENVKSFGINSNILSSYVDNASNLATCNDVIYCNDEEENNILNFTFNEEFYETDIISSTKQNNLEDI
ncbi:PREDICTED: probable ATP-dependent RNA helicase ddx42 [Eufriesea mexicana]|uniref:probable ATP-dependent RNA helicase ddx42 n=1 Tax=Eufriesea mexicana TaxID=516756 RepID=UPI00083BED44|nr:PREDICTED: probable ATP-dependent RNA helicase ddx42 [Eufriesea mexicana]